MSAVISELVRLLEKEARILRDFVRTPKGVFETVDDAVVAVREAVQSVKSKLLTERVRILRR